MRARRGSVGSSTLIRWGGMAAVVAGVMLVVLDLLSLLVFGFGQRVGEGFVPLGLLIRSTIAPVAGALLLLGLVGLYARQSEATGVPGLISFLVTFAGTELSLSGSARQPGLGFIWGVLPKGPSLPARGLNAPHYRRGGYRGS